MRSEKIRDGQRTFVEEARRAQIVQCAIEVLADDGYLQASLARIAERIGVSKAVIPYHFDGKEELFTQVAVQVVTQAEAYMRPRIEAAGGAAGKLCAFIESNLGYLGEHPKEVRALVEIVAHSRDDHGRPRGDMSGAANALTGLERILQLGQRNGEFRSFSTRVMATTVRAALDAVSAQLMTEPELDLTAYTADLVTLFDLATRSSP